MRGRPHRCLHCRRCAQRQRQQRWEVQCFSLRRRRTLRLRSWTRRSFRRLRSSSCARTAATPRDPLSPRITPRSSQVSEIGDKTFFIAALLAARSSKILTFAGCAGALAIMTVISVLIGQIFHAVPTTLTRGLPIDDYVAIASFVFFGIKSLLDALEVSNRALRLALPQPSRADLTLALGARLGRRSKMTARASPRSARRRSKLSRAWSPPRKAAGRSWPRRAPSR